jgi:hypothetical protein
MQKIVFAIVLLCSSATSFAQAPSSQPTTQATSQPALPPPEVEAPTEPLVGWVPPSFEEPASQPTEEARFDLLPPEAPRPASQIGNALFAAAGIGFISASSGALIGLISSSQLNNPGAAREETAIGWQLGSAFGSGLGVVLSARSHGRPGSRLGAFIGSTLTTSLAVAVAFPATNIVGAGIDNAKNPIPFFFAIPYVASIGGALLGYEFFPTKRASARLSSRSKTLQANR